MIERKERGWASHLPARAVAISHLTTPVPSQAFLSIWQYYQGVVTVPHRVVSYRVIKIDDPPNPAWQATAHLYLWNRLLESNKENKVKNYNMLIWRCWNAVYQSYFTIFFLIFLNLIFQGSFLLRWNFKATNATGQTHNISCINFKIRIF